MQQRTLAGFIGSGARLAGELVALSKKGAVICCSENAEPGTMGHLGIPIGHEMFRAVAMVRRRVPRVGIHFKFVKMSTRNRHLLHRLIMTASVNERVS